MLKKIELDLEYLESDEFTYTEKKEKERAKRIDEILEVTSSQSNLYNHGKRWREEETYKLKQMYSEDFYALFPTGSRTSANERKLNYIAKRLGRKIDSVKQKLKELNLI